MNRSGSSAENNLTNLLIVSYHLDRGGLEEVIRGYAAHLDRSKYALTIAYVLGGVASGEIGARGDVNMVELASTGRLGRFRKLWRVAREQRIHIVHNHFGWYGLLVGFLVGAKRVETMHNVYDWFTGAKRVGYAFYTLLAMRIIAVSDFVASGNIKYFRIIRQTKVTTIHNGIDVQHYEQAPDGGSRRVALGVGESEVVIGFVGRLEDQKGLPFLLKAAERLNKQFKNLRYVVVGSGSRDEALRAEASTLGIENMVFTGYERDVASYMKAFDVFVLPSLFEGLPMSLLEAMACHLPVVATRVGGIPEAVLEGVTGYLVDPGNVDQLVSRLAELVLRRDLRSMMGERGFERVNQEFSVKSMISKSERLYEQLLGR